MRMHAAVRSLKEKSFRAASTDLSIFNAFYVMKKFSILLKSKVWFATEIYYLSRVRYSLRNFDFEVECRIRSIFIQFSL